MAKLEDLGKVIETDVLVIGEGVSGLWAANRAREFVEQVTVVGKGPQDWGGLASMAGGDMLAVLPGEDIDSFVEDIVYYNDGLSKQDQVRQVFEQVLGRIVDYQRLGCQFLTEPDGRLKGIPQRGLKHVKLYTSKVRGPGGANIVLALMKQTRGLGVKRLGRVLVTDLLKHRGKIAGAVGFDTRSGEFYIFKAKAVVLATGECGWKTSYGANTATGEGAALALRAGAELSGFEFARVWNVPSLFSWEGQTALLPLGARFVNAKGESIMDKYSPVLGTNTDPHYVVRAMAIEARDGRGPFYLDCSHMKPEDRELMKPQGGWMQLNYHKLRELGMDFFDDMLEWMPQIRASCGGVTADIEGRSSVPGLFIVGLALASPLPGLTVGCWELSMTAVTGHITGGSVGKYTRSLRKLPEIDEDEVEVCKRNLYMPFERVGISPKEVLRELQETIFPADVCILKNEVSLKKALAKTESIRDELLPQMGARDAHYLMKLIEVRGILHHTELFLRASLMRTESRAGHYREDFPDYDNNNWLKWIIIHRKNGELKLSTEPVPFDKYKFKPTRFYSDNFRFPK